MKRWKLVVVIGLLLGACSSERQPSQSARTVDSPPPSTSEDELTLEDEWPLVHASSKDAHLGAAVRFRLHTHCGVDWSVDFDGSFWDAIGEGRAIRRGAYRGLGNPSDWGTMTLVAGGPALYESNSGVMIAFTRAGESRRISPCF